METANESVPAEAAKESVIADDPRKASLLAVVLSTDSNQAWITRPPGGDVPLAPTREEIEKLLRDSTIQITDAVAERISDYIALFSPVSPLECESSGSPADGGAVESTESAPSSAPPEIPERYLIAEGRPPTEPQNAVFEWYEQFQKTAEDWKGDESINYYDICAITTIDAGVAIGRIVPAKPGEGGVDVLGRFVKPTRKPLEMKVGKGLLVSEEDPGELITETPGRIVIEGMNIFVDENLNVGGDVDFNSGSIDACINVDVRDTVRSKFTVKTTKSLTIGAGIEAAVIEVGGDLTVRDGIIGQGEGTVKVGGGLTAKFCEEANVTAEGDVKILKELVNSRVYSNGKLLAEHGMIIGGTTFARCGIAVRALGSDACVKTQVIVGLHPDVVAQLKKMEDEAAQNRKAAQQIRSKVEPLMANLKRLTATQREQATELMCKADEIDMSVEEIEQRRDKLIEESRPPEHPGVLVIKLIHAGVQIQIGARQTTFDSQFKGPVRIKEQKINNVTEIVAVDQISKSVTILPTEDLNFKTEKKDE